MPSLRSADVPVTEHRVQSGDVVLAAREAGEGPAVVLLHGLTATRRYVVMGSRTLERGGHRVIAYDARGHGHSHPALDARAYGYEHLAADLEAVLDDLGIERAVLAGASMGSHTALRFALERPWRVAALVIITPAFDPARGEDAAALLRWDALAQALRESGVEGFVSVYAQREIVATYRETVLKVVRQRLAAHQHLNAVADALNFVPRSRPFAELNDLRRLDMPVLLVGSRDEADPEHPLSVAHRYAQTIARSRLVVEEPGRSPIAWQGGQLSRLIAEFTAEAGSGP